MTVFRAFARVSRLAKALVAWARAKWTPPRPLVPPSELAVAAAYAEAGRLVREAVGRFLAEPPLPNTSDWNRTVTYQCLKASLGDTCFKHSRARHLSCNGISHGSWVGPYFFWVGPSTEDVLADVAMWTENLSCAEFVYAETTVHSCTTFVPLSREDLEAELRRAFSPARVSGGITVVVAVQPGAALAQAHCLQEHGHPAARAVQKGRLPGLEVLLDELVLHLRVAREVLHGPRARHAHHRCE